MIRQTVANQGLVTALFTDADGVERAYHAALDRGYETSEINLMLSEETRQRHFARGQVNAELAGKAADSTEDRSRSAGADATELGGPAGATAGTLAPAAAAIGTALLLPGLILAGPVAVALTAAGAVGVTGGVIGALTDWGIPKDRVEEYESHIRQGGILIGVQARSEDDVVELQRAWIAAGGRMVKI